MRTWFYGVVPCLSRRYLGLVKGFSHLSDNRPVCWGPCGIRTRSLNRGVSDKGYTQPRVFSDGVLCRGTFKSFVVPVFLVRLSGGGKTHSRPVFPEETGWKGLSSHHSGSILFTERNMSLLSDRRCVPPVLLRLVCPKQSKGGRIMVI